MPNMTTRDDGSTFENTSSEVCLCGPRHEPQQSQHNQFLKVERRTTDKESLLLITLFTAFLVMMWYYAIDKGQYLLLVNGMDWKGRACGSGELSGYPHQAWTNPMMHDIHSSAICVDTCPAPAGGAAIQYDQLTCLCNPALFPKKFSASDPERSQALVEECAKSDAQRLGYFTKVVNAGDALLNDAKSGANGGAEQPCAFTYRTKWAMRRCVPWLSANETQYIVDQSGATTTETHNFIADALNKANAVMQTFMTDIVASGPVLGFCLFIALLLSMASMICLRYCVDIIAKGILFTILMLFMLASMVSWKQFEFYSDRTSTVPALMSHEQDEQNMYVYIALFVTSIIATIAHLCFSVYMWSQLEAAISIIKVASETFTDAPQILLYPIIHLWSFITMFGFWVVGAVLLYSSGDIVTGSNGVAHLEHTPLLRSAGLFYLFGLFWLSSFLNAVGYMILAGTIYICTFAQPKTTTDPETGKKTEIVGALAGKDIPNSVMSSAACVIIRYHLGTAACGSLLLFLIWPFSFLIGIFNRLANYENVYMKYLCCCFQSCVYCFENCTKYMNKMAYLQTVLHGFAFCFAAFDGMGCVLRGLSQIGPTTFISSFVLVVIKLSITLFTTVLASVCIDGGLFDVDASDIEYTWIPYITVGAASYVICTTFMLILEVAIDAVMVAFCEAKFEEKGGITESQLPRELVDHMILHGTEVPDGASAPGEGEPLLGATNKTAH